MPGGEERNETAFVKDRSIGKRMLLVFLLVLLVVGKSVGDTRKWTSEMTVALLIDTIAEVDGDSSFWALQQDEKRKRQCLGYCVFGGSPAVLDGWYAKANMNTYVNKEKKLIFDQYWQMRNGEEVILFSKTKEYTVPMLPSEWTGSIVAPYVLPADAGTACEIAVKELKKSSEASALLQSVLSPTTKEAVEPEVDDIFIRIFGRGITLAVFAATALGLGIYFFTRYFLAFWRQPGEIEMEMEPSTEDELGAPPSYVRRGLDSLIEDLVAADEEAFTAATNDDDEILLAAALDDAMEIEYLRARTNFNFSEEDFQTQPERKQHLLAFILSFTVKCLRFFFALIIRSVYHYMKSTTDLTKPVLLLLILACSVLIKRLLEIEGSVNSSRFNSIDWWGPVRIILFVLAAFDFLRRALLNTFWFLLRIGLGELRNEENTILLKCVYEELTVAFVLIALISFEVGFMTSNLFFILAVVGFTGILSAVSRLARARLVYLVKTRPICDNRYLSSDETMNGFTMSQFWRAYLYRSLDHFRLSLLSIILFSITIASSLFVYHFLAFHTQLHSPHSVNALTLIQVVALAAYGAKRPLQVILHQLVLFATEFGVFFWPKMHLLLVWRFYGRLAAKRLWDKQHNVIPLVPGTESSRRCTSSVTYRASSTTRQKKDTVSTTKVAAYYVEYYSEVLGLIITLTWYVSEFISSRTAWFFYSIFAQQIYSNLRTRLRFHRAWLAARRASTSDSHNGLRLATDTEVKEYNDVCVVCLASFSEDDADISHSASATERRKAKRDRLPIKLPNCHHLFHLDCLRVYLSPTSAQSSTAAGKASCPVCRKPIAPLQACDQSHTPPPQQPPPPPQEDNDADQAAELEPMQAEEEHEDDRSNMNDSPAVPRSQQQETLYRTELDDDDDAPAAAFSGIAIEEE